MTIPPERPKKVPEPVEQAIAIMDADGAKQVDIAEVFGLSPRTVRSVLARYSEEEKRSLRQILAMRQLSDHAKVATKALGELLERNFGERDPKTGRFVISSPQLMVMLGIGKDAFKVLAEESGMSDPETAGGNKSSALAAWHATEAQIERAMRGLPPGSQLIIRQNQEVTVSGGPPSPSGGAVEATFSSSEDSDTASD